MNEEDTPRKPILPPVIKLLIISNVIIYLIQQPYMNVLVNNFGLWPLEPPRLMSVKLFRYEFMPWQLVTYAFLHGSLMHLLFNMYALWLFGVRLENLWGSRIFAIYFFVCVIGAALSQLLFSSLSGGYYPTIGASGGVFGVLLAFGMFYPNQQLVLLFPPIPIKAKWFVLLYGVIELTLGVTGTEAGVAHFAHLGGMLFGLVMIYHWQRHPPNR